MHAARAAELLWANEFGFVSILPHRHCPVAHKRVGNTVAAASSPQEPGLEAFESLIAERRFICTQCGKCCTGDGEVWITDEEAQRIATHLNLPLQRFYQQYTRAYSKVEGFKLLRAQNNPTRDCIFLQPDQTTCGIHAVRPLQCSTYPWWPDLMSDHDWSWEKENICEGFDHPDAPPTDKDDAARQLRAATAMEYRRMLSRKPSKKQKKAAAATAAAALANLQPAVSTPAPMETGDADMPGNSSSSSSSRVPLAEQATPEAEPAEASSGSVGMSGSNSKAAAPAEKWQQRLLRLQDLTSSDSLDDT